MVERSHGMREVAGSIPVFSTPEEEESDGTMTPIEMLLSLFAGWQMCLAGNFGYDGDQHAGGDAVCIGRPVGNEVGIAHRDLPCGTRVVLVNPRNMRSVVARVVDHGPYGARLGRRWVVKRYESDPGSWRGCLDLTPMAARRIDHNGMEDVLYLPVVQR